VRLGAAAGVVIGVCWQARPVAAQLATAAPRAAPAATHDTAALARIRAALAMGPPPDLTDHTLSFYARVDAKPYTFADYLKGSRYSFAITPIVAPTAAGLHGGGGIDLLGLFRQARDAYRERQARQIRQRIDDEVRSLEARSTAP
jgi:hypothetical protein